MAFGGEEGKVSRLAGGPFGAHPPLLWEQTTPSGVVYRFDSGSRKAQRSEVKVSFLNPQRENIKAA